MRLYARLFLCATLVISASLLLSGYLLITTSFDAALDRETDRAGNQYLYEKFSVQSSLISSKGLDDLSLSLNEKAAVFTEDLRQIYSTLPDRIDYSIIDEVSENTIVQQFQSVDAAQYVITCGKFTQSGITLYLVTGADVSEVTAQKEQMTMAFSRIYFIALGGSMVVMLFLSALITTPLKRMNSAAAGIARGHYDERLPAYGGELGELAESFNLMAEAIEGKINELTENARQKEDFVANFAHELKTPLTSVIGYADMLYQKDLPPEKVKNAAWYVLSEGLRLEALSLKLMDLIVLNRQDFTLEEMQADELLQHIAGSLKPVLADKNVTISLDVFPETVMVEYDLFKTLLLNLIDNAIKAGGDKIEVIGKTDGDRYSIYIADNGRGIPQSELTRITEAFYMVDKSRSRKQHGAGLGLALADRIARIHGNALEFVSREGAGTAVRIILIRKEKDGDE